MIYYISRKEHQNTVSAIRQSPSITLLDYDTLFKMRHLPRGTCIFSDLDRLHPWDRELAACMYKEIREAGCIAVNDPARVLSRYDLLKQLHNDGINDFNTYRLSAGEEPERYPVFLRRDSFHEGVFSDLIHAPEDLKAKHEELVSKGIPATNLLAIEFAAEKEPGGYFKKMSVYRIGEHYFPDTSVVQRAWEVKSGENGVAEEDYFEKELTEMNTIPHEATVRRAFEIANISYGRLDLGFYKGKPQIYEINTNPTVSSLSRNSPSPARDQSRAIFHQNFSAALNTLDTGTRNPKIQVAHGALKRRRRKAKWFQESYPTI